MKIYLEDQVYQEIELVSENNNISIREAFEKELRLFRNRIGTANSDINVINSCYINFFSITQCITIYKNYFKTFLKIILKNALKYLFYLRLLVLGVV